MATVEYGVLAYPVDPGEERGSIPYWFSDNVMPMQIGEYPTRARAVRKAVDYKDRYKVGTMVIKLVYDENGNEISEETLESFSP